MKFSRESPVTIENGRTFVFENDVHRTNTTAASCSHSTSIMMKKPSFLPKQGRPKRICLFGTSANPPTGDSGHCGVIRALVELQRFDEVRILPVYRHTFSSKRHQLLGFDHRVAMCERLIEELPISQSTKVVVSRAEEDSFQRMLQVSKAVTDEEKAALRVGTADLLEMLMEDEKKNNNKNATVEIPMTEFSFCLGADTFMDLTDWKWKRSQDVLKLLEGRLVVINRKQQDNIDTQHQQKNLLKNRIDEINATPLGEKNIVLLDVPSLGDVSSSKIRNAENKDLVKHMLSQKVLEYVTANNLYGFGETAENHDGNIVG